METGSNQKPLTNSRGLIRFKYELKLMSDFRWTECNFFNRSWGDKLGYLKIRKSFFICVQHAPLLSIFVILKGTRLGNTIKCSISFECGLWPLYKQQQGAKRSHVFYDGPSIRKACLLCPISSEIRRHWSSRQILKS